MREENQRQAKEPIVVLGPRGIIVVTPFPNLSRVAVTAKYKLSLSSLISRGVSSSRDGSKNWLSIPSYHLSDLDTSKGEITPEAPGSNSTSMKFKFWLGAVFDVAGNSYNKCVKRHVIASDLP